VRKHLLISGFYSRCLALIVLLASAWLDNAVATSAKLPIYIEDSHAGSFYYLAQRLDLDRPYTLLLFDTHSDASPIFNSDAIRVALRGNSDPPGEASLLSAWRESGKIQCYNWIEPLMPLPFARVLWIPPKDLNQTQIFQLQNESRVFLDGHEEVCPRSEPNLSRCYSVTDFSRLKTELSTLDRPDQPIVVSIDLDYFINTPDEDLEHRFREIFLLALSVRHLAALTFSVSTPYLRDFQQADRLLALAVEYSCRVANADIAFEPFATTGPDTSGRANQLRTANSPIPRLILDWLSETTRNRLLSRADQLDIKEKPDQWNEFRAFSKDRLPEIRVRNHLAETPLTISRTALDHTQLEAVLPADAKSVQWYSLRSAADSYSLSNQEFGFADGAPRWIYREPVPLSVEPILQGQNLRRAFDARTGYGVADVFVRVETGSGSFDSKVLRVTCIADSVSRFQQALSAEFNLPYIFFGGKLAAPGATGPEVGFGSDCANFIIYGLRQAGWQIPWSDAKHLISSLRLMARVDLDQPHADMRSLVRLQPDDIYNGVIIVFDNHVAALWSSSNPGFLGLNDLVVHQLEGRPEIFSLAELARTRHQFSVLTVPKPLRTIRILVGGDVMLGRTNGQKILEGTDIFRFWEPTIYRTDLLLGNLECSICTSSLTPATKPYRFRAPPEASNLLAKVGFRGMLVANNHTGDFGLVGFEQTISALNRAGVAPIGGGSNLRGAATPARFDHEGARIAVFGCADPGFCSPIASAIDAGICPWDSSDLLEAIGQAKIAGEFCVVLCHWDADNDLALCRAKASEWIDTGADVVVGSGPHRVLGSEILRGHPVFYSIGNLLFDGGGADPEWSRGALVELVIAQPGSLVRARIIDPIRRQPTANEH
jgi:poly-gamma-glutamate capsule biosynthesis protein CapA/YwtB (metallophosphatase superfamily)